MTALNFNFFSSNVKQEFEELWSGVFGGGSPVPYPEVVVEENLTVEVYFAQEDGVETQIIEELEGARRPSTLRPSRSQATT